MPPPAARKKLTARLQKAVDGAVNTTRFHGTTKNLQMQHHQNGGQRHINVAARLDAAWTMIAVRLAVGKSAPWQGPWWDALRHVYGRLAGPALVQSTTASTPH